MAKHSDDQTPVHPVLSFVRDASSALVDLADQPLWSLDQGESRRLVHDLARLAAQVAELEARAITQAEASGAVADDGIGSTRAWLCHHTKITPAAATRKVRLTAVGAQTREALTRGDVHAEQATVIATAIDDLTDVPTGEQERAEKHLLGEAAHHDARDLARLGRRILEHLDPARADEHEARLLEQQEASAAKKTRLRIWDDAEGLTHGTFTLPTAQGAMLRKALHAYAAPKHVRATEGAGSYDHDVPTPARLGQAFVSYIERYPVDQLPRMGGLAATVIVTMTLDTLTGGDRAAWLDTGDQVSPGQARRWACEAGIMPTVLDGESHVLDLGRLRRFHSPAQRMAVTIEQRHCQRTGCTVAAAFCHVHHRTRWADGGHTTVGDAELLCPFHHHEVHASGDTHPTRT